MRTIVMSAIAALLVLMPLASAQAQGKSKNKAAGTKYEAAKGLYAQGGFTIAKTNFENNNLDPRLGFAFAGGYRFLHWLGADGELYWAGRDQAGGKTRGFGLTFNGKVYPIGLLAPKTLDSFQPYVVMGMGGGNYKFKPDGGSDTKTGTFIYRLGVGVDWMLTDNIGTYADFSLHATPGTKEWVSFKGGATGVIQFGAKVNF